LLTNPQNWIAALEVSCPKGARRKQPRLGQWIELVEPLRLDWAWCSVNLS